MRRLTFTSSLLLLLFLLCSCATKQLPPPKLEFAENAIKIHVKADPKLNLSDGKPHTLLVCVYQLKNPNGLNQLAGDDRPKKTEGTLEHHQESYGRGR